MQEALDPRAALERARRALATVPPPSDPFAAAVVRARAPLGLPSDPLPLLAWWRGRDIGNPTSAMRYRWELSHERSGTTSWCGPPGTWRAWRALEQELLDRDPFRFEERISGPVILAETCDLLVELSEADGPHRAEAASFLEEALPVFRRDLSFFLQGANPWGDSFALSCLARTPRALEKMHPFALAIAACHAPGARQHGMVRGARFPFHGVPLVSASAQLAAGLVALGTDLDVVAGVVAELRAQQRPDGGWGDGDGPADPLTSFAAADILAHADPTFDASGVLAWFERTQSPAGFWSALGPDAPWLTSRIALWMLAMGRPFSERFRWPFVSVQQLDQKTGLPTFAYFIDVARLFRDLPGLASADTEVAFIDLAGFGAFNNAHGQEMGDAVLAAFAAELGTLRSARPIRDGGDEFLVVGAPGRAGLMKDLDAFRRQWPASFVARFGRDAPPVAPRILVIRGRGDALRAAREALGRLVSGVKHRVKSPPAEGVLSDVGRLGERT